MHVAAITVGPFHENTYLVMDPVSGDAVLVDPGDEGARIIAMVEKAGANVQAIWLTHGHLDHIGGIAAVKRKWDVPIFMHPLDEPVYNSGRQSAMDYGVPFEEPPPYDRKLHEGDQLRVGAFTFEVMHVPGHTPGHVAFVGNGVVIGGDVLFLGSIGRTDLPGANPADMEVSLIRFAALPPATIVYAGHGEPTMISTEIEENPFLNGAARIVRR